jgi:hypothetical protein
LRLTVLTVDFELFLEGFLDFEALPLLPDIFRDEVLLAFARDLALPLPPFLAEELELTGVCFDTDAPCILGVFGVVLPTEFMKSSMTPVESVFRSRFQVRGDVDGDIGLNEPGSGSSKVSIGINPWDMPAPGIIWKRILLPPEPPKVSPFASFWKSRRWTNVPFCLFESESFAEIGARARLGILP